MNKIRQQTQRLGQTWHTRDEWLGGDDWTSWEIPEWFDDYEWHDPSWISYTQEEYEQDEWQEARFFLVPLQSKDEACHEGHEEVKAFTSLGALHEYAPMVGS